ncbi:MamI family restriction endonuclease [uncultured Fibrobacter sp.]|uniref:MamI family restriction endonuclease n=1 Tax=uncultured Fibrobacter sp. TaxID=261512 RepID=UPI0025D93ED9|nr:MamI family restriction endonuclease [uncultured Fibrobacter sp.]
MDEKASYYFQSIDQIYQECKQNKTDICKAMSKITHSIPTHSFPVAEKVQLSNYILKKLTKEERKALAQQLLEEQVIKQRNKLNHWSFITAQSSQIDTGYIAQHLVSLQTQIAGQGMRGKGDDLSDGSEVKSANFLDSLDKRGAVSPRWNFTAGTPKIMEQFLEYPALYLLSMDLNSCGKFRTRIWKVNVQLDSILTKRYKLWMKILGYPKFNSSEKQSVNFQLFPPHSGTEESYARHGKGQTFEKIQIPLENQPYAKLIFRADEEDGNIKISKF